MKCFINVSFLLCCAFAEPNSCCCCFFSALEEPDKTISRGGPYDGISYVNFVEDKFFFLNITTLGGNTVDDMPECSFACLDTPSCFSFNLAAFPDISNKLLCELLPSDKYNNSDKFMQSDTFHHFSIAVSEQARKKKYINIYIFWDRKVTHFFRLLLPRQTILHGDEENQTKIYLQKKAAVFDLLQDKFIALVL